MPTLTITHDEAEAISVAEAKQRAGRGGREAAGKAWRLYTEKAFESPALMPPAPTPDIQRVDLAEVG